VTDYRSAATSDRALAHNLFLACTLEGYYTGVGEFILSAPMENEHIDGLLEATGRVLAA
jgi:hypothetical protein